MTFLDWLSEQIAARGMSEREFCRKVGLNDTWLGTSRSRGTSKIYTDTFVAMADFLGMTVDELAKVYIGFKDAQ